MIFTYGCWLHIVSILTLPLFAAVLFLIFRNKTLKCKKLVVFVLLCLNLLQHIFKFIIWPHYYGTGFSLINTAYNFCALVIIVAPILFFTNLKSIKTFICFIGTIAGLIAICVPYWFVDGQANMTDPYNISEFARFYTCHCLLFLSSILCFLFRLQKVNWKDFWKNGLYVLLFLAIIALNNFVYKSIEQGSFEKGFEFIKTDNYCWVNGPKEIGGLNWLMDFLKMITLPIFVNNGEYTMILWYAIPVYVLFTLVSFVVYVLIDWVNFKKTFKNDRKET